MFCHISGTSCFIQLGTDDAGVNIHPSDSNKWLPTALSFTFISKTTVLKKNQENNLFQTLLVPFFCCGVTSLFSTYGPFLLFLIRFASWPSLLPVYSILPFREFPGVVVICSKDVFIDQLASKMQRERKSEGRISLCSFPNYDVSERKHTEQWTQRYFSKNTKVHFLSVYYLTKKSIPFLKKSVFENYTFLLVLITSEIVPDNIFNLLILCHMTKTLIIAELLWHSNHKVAVMYRDVS